MRHIIFLLFAALTLQAFAQYPATGNKARLGWQTTGDGLVYRGAIGDTTTLDPSGINNAWMLLDTASGNLYAYRTKAWRLVSGGGGGGGLTMPFDSVTFNVNETDASLRELKYSEEKGYLQYGGQDSVQIPILPGIWYVRNDDSVTISKGMVLRASGTLGASGRIKVKRMIADGSIDAMYILGIAMHDIAVGADGYAMSQGKIRQVNTQAYSEGAVLYADVDTLGGLTQTEPGNGFLKLPIAFVVHSASNGTIAVRITSGAYMRDLHDVEITSPVSNASLYYNAAQGIWRDTGAAVLVADTAAMLTNYINVVDTAAMLTNYINIADTATMLSSYISNADTSVFARDFQISGTTNYIPKFTGANTIGNSVIQDNGTNVGISASPSSFKLDINGSTHTTGDFYADRASRSASAGFVSAQTNNRWLAGMISNSGSWHVYDLLRSTSVMTLDSATGNVGIGTASPSRPLHVAGTTAIRIPVGTTSDRGTSANGDIRYNTTNANFEWHTGTAWREPVNAARSPNTVGIANRFSKFDANGLLDTSAVLTQSGNNIGVGVTPTERLQVEGTVRARRLSVNTFGSQVISINNFAPNGSAGDNLFIGNGGQNSTWVSGDDSRGNMAIGANSLFSNTRGSFNLAFGESALSANLTGGSNVAIGRAAMSIGTGEVNSIAIGSYALQNNSNGTGENVAVGSSAMQSAAGSFYNVAIGSSALLKSQWQRNVAIGRASMAEATTSTGANAAIGVLSLGNVASNSSFNVAIGDEAGFKIASGSNLTKTNQSIYIGYDARPSVNDNTNEIIIGDQGRGNGSNTTTIGNSSTTHTVLQYGETLLGYAASGDVGDYRVQVNGNGYVSGEFRIGYTADQGAYPLQVNGQIFATNATIATSDARLKQDIEPLKSGLKEVLSLNPVTYTFKPDTVNNYPKGKQVGFLAQEIQSTVQGDYAGSIIQEAGGYLGVADTKLIPLLVKAIQEQQAQIEALKKEIEALKK